MAGRGLDRVTPAWMKDSGGSATTGPIASTMPSVPTRERSRSRERTAPKFDSRRDNNPYSSSSFSSTSLSTSSSTFPSTSSSSSSSSFPAPSSLSHIPDAFSQLRNLAEKHGGNIQFPFQQQVQSNNSSSSTSSSSTSNSSNYINRPFRRLYIGNIPQDCRDSDLKIFLVSCIKACNPSTPDDMIAAITVNNDKKFAFVEFKTLELTTSVLEKLSGLIFMGSQLKMKRPNDASGPPPPQGPPIPLDTTMLVSQGILCAPLQTPSLGGVSGSASQPDKRFHGGEIFERFGPIEKTVADQPGKIFCGGLPYNLTDVAVLELFRAFGEVKSFHLVRDPPDSPTHKGYCFIAYHDEKQTDHVIASFNGMFIGDKALSVRRSNTTGSGVGGAQGVKQVSAPAVTHPYGVPQASGGGATSFAGGAYSGISTTITPSYQAPSAPSLAPPQVIASRTIQLQNVPLGDDDFATKDSYDGLVEEMREELRKYGNITLMHIPRGGPQKGDVFAQYSSPQEAAVSRKELQGRSFAGKIVSCILVQDDRIRQVSLLAPPRPASWGPTPQGCL